MFQGSWKVDVVNAWYRSTCIFKCFASQVSHRFYPVLWKITWWLVCQPGWTLWMVPFSQVFYFENMCQAGCFKEVVINHSLMNCLKLLFNLLVVAGSGWFAFVHGKNPCIIWRKILSYSWYTFRLINLHMEICYVWVTQGGKSNAEEIILKKLANALLEALKGIDLLVCIHNAVW